MTIRKLQILAICGVAVATAFMLGIAIRPKQPTTPTRSPAPVSTEAISRLFSLQLDDHLGNKQHFSQWQGKLLVINFWASWCAPCREEMPYFSRISRDYTAKGVQFVGISTDSASTIRAFADQHQISYPLLVGAQFAIELSAELGNTQLGLPYTLVLGSNRELLLAHTGRVSESELEGVVKRNLVP